MNAKAWRSRVLARMGDGFTVRGKSGADLYEDRSIPESEILRAARQFREGRPWRQFVQMFPDDHLPD